MSRRKRMTILAKVDLCAGEAEVSNMHEIDELMAENPLLAADVLADVLHDVQEAYDRAVRLLDREIKDMVAAAGQKSTALH